MSVSGDLTRVPWKKHAEQGPTLRPGECVLVWHGDIVLTRLRTFALGRIRLPPTIAITFKRVRTVGLSLTLENWKNSTDEHGCATGEPTA